MAFTPNEITISQLFQAAFTRAVSASGALGAWVLRFEGKMANGLTNSEAQQDILREMNLSPESTSVYGPLDARETVTFIFTNSLGRGLSSEGALDAWAQRAEGISLEQLQNEILAAARTNDDFIYMENLVDQAEIALGRADTVIINISADDSSTLQGTDGIAETFVYEIDSSSYFIESEETADISLQGFNATEDKLVFQDVSNGTTSTEFFADDVFDLVADTDTQITFDLILSDNEDIGISEEGFLLTLVGITDFSAVDYSVA